MWLLRGSSLVRSEPIMRSDDDRAVRSDNQRLHAATRRISSFEIRISFLVLIALLVRCVSGEGGELHGGETTALPGIML